MGLTKVSNTLVSYIADCICYRTNRTLFTHVPARPITESELAEVHNPTVSGEAGIGLIEAAYDDGEQEGEGEGVSSVVERLGEDLTTLSLVPRSRWQTLIQLDLIKVVSSLFVAFLVLQLSWTRRRQN